MSSGNMPLATMALFALGLGVTLSPVSVATALSLPGSETPPTGRTAHP
jgi:hypothetical protein